jgi:hypothetical protein
MSLKIKVILCAFFCALVLVYKQAAAQSIAINEIMASNSSTIADQDGDFEDWIELFNYGNEPVDLEGYGLSDDYDNPFKWVFPPVVIGPGEYLLVWASGKDRKPDLHTNFRIDRDGEEILLTASSLYRVDEVAPVEIPTDVSFGRYPNGTGTFYYFTLPTPGEANLDDGLTSMPVVPDPPVFSHEGGTFTSSFHLGFEYEDGLNVYYTVNDNIPVPGVSNRYTTPFLISETTLVRAITHSPEGVSSELVKAVYTRLDQTTSQFSSNLPLMVIHQFSTPIDERSPHPRSPAYITLSDTGEDGRARLSDDPVLQGRVMINVRGSSSVGFPKKMYGFHLIEEDGSNRKEPLLNMPEEHNWILNGPFSDKSLMRNVIAYGLSNDIGRYAPRTRFIELYLHAGNGPLTQDHYHGIYVLTERIKWADGRVEIEKITPEDNSEPEITGGYIFKRDRLNTGETGFRTQSGSLFAFARPSESDITIQQKSWLENHLTQFETALFGNNFTDPKEGYEKYIDSDSFIDAHMITELLKEIDGYRLSTFFHKDRGGRIFKGPLWDFNISLGNVDYYPDPGYTTNLNDREPWSSRGWYYELLSQHLYLYGWFTRLFEDTEFSARYNERWWQLRRGQFSDDSLKKRINMNALLLHEAQQRNFTRWPVLNRYVWPNYFVGPTYSSEVAWMRDWLMGRTKWIDGQFGKPSTLIHFWHFNELPDVLNEVMADHSLGGGMIVYQDGNMDRVNDGTLLNADQGVPAGAALRVRNPSYNRELVFSLPTSGYKNIVFRYMVKRTPNGARKQTVYYRDKAGSGWTPFGDTLMITETYRQFRFDFSKIAEAEDNPEFSIRIMFHGAEAEDASGNNRFDNITLEGRILIDDDDDDIDGVKVYHSASNLHVEIPYHGLAHIEVFNLSGHALGRFHAFDKGLHSFWFIPPAGIYIVRVQAGNEVFRKKIFVVN